VSDPKPKLVAVGSAKDEGASVRAPQQRRRGTDLGAGFWLIVVILIAAVMIIAAQMRGLDRLTAQVETLETELSASHSALRGYESRFGEIRESVGDLRAQLSQLEGLVEEPPAPAPSP
jgi:hypothetical protein